MASLDGSGKWRGLFIAALIYLGWLGHLIFWLSAELDRSLLPWWRLPRIHLPGER